MHIHSHLPLLLLFHECEGVFYFLRPVLLGQRIWNTLFLLALSIGQGLMVWLYSVEYYARYFCPKEVSSSTNLTVAPNSVEYVRTYLRLQRSPLVV